MCTEKFDQNILERFLGHFIELGHIHLGSIVKYLSYKEIPQINNIFSNNKSN